MNATLFIARMFGLTYIILALIMLFKRDLLGKVMEDFCKSTAGIFFTGAFTLIIGLAIILTHNNWAWNWTVVITILGWLCLVKGIWLIAFPESVSKLSNIYSKGKGFPLVQAVGGLLFGIYLTYMGFFAG